MIIFDYQSENVNKTKNQRIGTVQKLKVQIKSMYTETDACMCGCGQCYAFKAAQACLLLLQYIPYHDVFKKETRLT